MTRDTINEPPTGNACVLLLPQYEISTLVAERIWKNWNECPARQRYVRAIADDHDLDALRATQEEVQADLLSYFQSKLGDARTAFRSEMAAAIGRERYDDFADTLAVDWYRKGKNDPASQRLMASVWQWYCQKHPFAAAKRLELAPNATPSFTVREIDALATCTRQNLQLHLHAWLGARPRGDEPSIDKVFVRRGLPLAKSRPTGEPFRDDDCLNSYSLSITVPEQFATQAEARIPAPSLFHLPYDYAESRVLFFSPFIDDMPFEQLELALMPPEDEPLVLYQGAFEAVHEHLLCSAADLEYEKQRFMLPSLHA